MDPIKVKLELGITMQQAKEVVVVIQGRANPKDYASVNHYISQCYSDPDPYYLKLLAVSEILKAHGVEHVGSYSYVNRGDLYIPTIIHNGFYFQLGVLADLL